MRVRVKYRRISSISLFIGIDTTIDGGAQIARPNAAAPNDYATRTYVYVRRIYTPIRLAYACTLVRMLRVYS